MSRYEGDFEEEVDFITEKNDGVDNEPAENNKDSDVDFQYDSDESDDENEQVLIVDRNQELVGEESCTKIIAPGQGLHPIP